MRATPAASRSALPARVSQWAASWSARRPEGPTLRLSRSALIPLTFHKMTTRWRLQALVGPHQSSHARRATSITGPKPATATP
jgi:hypothetical protein